MPAGLVRVFWASMWRWPRPFVCRKMFDPAQRACYRKLFIGMLEALAAPGGLMDQIVMAAGTALAGAIASDAWQQVRDAVTGLWRRVHPHHADGIGAELDELREQVLRARRDGDTDTEKALEGAWQVKLQGLLRADPALAAGLRRVLDQVLTPALTAAGQARIAAIFMAGSSHDSSTFTQIGTQTIYNRP